MFSRVGRYIYRSSDTRGSTSGIYGARSAMLSELTNGNGCTLRAESGLGIARSYLTSVGACKHAANRGILKAINSLLTGPRLRRLWSDAPKKKFENYYPRSTKEILEGNNHKSEQKISFQEFHNKLLEPGLVDHIVVSNNSVAKVYVKSLPNVNKDTNGNTVPGDTNGNTVPGDANGRNASYYKYYFNIGSIESFEEKLEEVQEALGIDHRNYVPVTYVYQTNFFQEFMKFGPTLLLLGTLIYMGKRSGFSVGGPGGKGGHGLFSIGKAPITKMDKNAKNKVFFKDVAWM